VKFTLLWQWKSFPERDWIARLFEPFTAENVFDTEHRIVFDNCVVIDACLHYQPGEYYRQFRGLNAWLVHLSEETYEGGYEKYEHFRGVIRCYWSSFFNPQRVMHIPLGYPAGFGGNAGQPGTASRPYLWSFLGGSSRASRPEMIRAFQPLTPHFLHLTDRGAAERLGRPEYEQLLRESIFAPCPMGNVNLESYRVYEALECGAIPIVEKRIGLDYFTGLLGSHPLPAFTNWRQAARFVEKLRGDRAALDGLQSECMDWWKAYQKSLTQRMADFFDSPHGDEAGPCVRWRRSIPGAQAIELMRHHTVPALARRIKLQSLRLVQEGRVRKTWGA